MQDITVFVVACFAACSTTLSNSAGTAAVCRLQDLYRHHYKPWNTPQSLNTAILLPNMRKNTTATATTTNPEKYVLKVSPNLSAPCVVENALECV